MRILEHFISTAFAFVVLLIAKSNQSSDSPDTSLYDWVAYHLLEDYVDLLEMTAWYARKVKDHIDDLIEDSFILLTKQQDMLQPALELTDKYNRPDCAEGKILNVTDAVFHQYFNMNINCPMLGQKMAVFFNELHNITERITMIHRRHMNMAPGCGPPTLMEVNRDCLQNLINACKKDTGLLREHMLNLDYDVEDFMDGQIEEAFLCTLSGMSYVRNVTKQAVQDIHCCLDIEENYEIRKKYESPLLDAAMGRLKGPYDHIDLSAEKIKRPPNPQQQFLPPQPGGPPHPGMAYPHYPPPPQHPQMHVQPGMAPPPPHPGVQPQFIQHPGMPPQHPGMPPQHPGMQPQFVQHPGMQPPHPGMQPQFIPHPGMYPQQQGYQQPPADRMQPRNPLKSESKSQPPWRINPRNIPNYARKDNMIRDGSFEFDPSIFAANEKKYGNIFGEELGSNDNFHDSL